MRKLITLALLSITLILSGEALAETYTQRLCNSSEFNCFRVQRGESWESLFGDPMIRERVMRINRMNTQLYKGMVIAVPKNLYLIQGDNYAYNSNSDAYSSNSYAYNSNSRRSAPFNDQISSPGRKTVIVDPNLRAWAAYTADGQLIRWGRASAGRDYCPDIKRGCRTVAGKFAIYTKRGPECKSSKYPLPRGGAPTPYCMFFHKGYALHGSNDVPNHNASHGCVRLLVEDARWLNQEFAEIGTRVIVRPYYYRSSNSYMDTYTDSYNVLGF